MIALVYWMFTFALAATSSLHRNFNLCLMVALAGLAILGHSKSIWLGFLVANRLPRASIGNVVASRFGNAGCFGVVMALSRIVSLSSIAGAIAVSVLMLSWVNRSICCLL